MAGFVLCRGRNFVDLQRTWHSNLVCGARQACAEPSQLGLRSRLDSALRSHGNCRVASMEDATQWMPASWIAPLFRTALVQFIMVVDFLQPSSGRDGLH